MNNSKLLFLSLVFGLFSVSGCSGLVSKFAFYPDKHNIIPVEDLPDDIEEIFFTTGDNLKLQAYFASHQDSDRIVIFFHGNAGNICQRIPDILTLKKCGVNVLGVSYRGYGKSEGKPSEKGVYIDGEAAFLYAQEKLGFTERNIIMFGRSIGTTVAVHVSQHKDINRLILITPLTSGKAVAKESGFGIFSLLVGDAFNNLSKILNIKCPVLIIHGTKDEVIPFKMGQELYDRINNRKQFVSIEGATHNDLSVLNPEKYWRSIYNFINPKKIQ